MQNKRKLFKIGVTAIFALVLLVVGINFLKGINLFKSSNSYFAVYTDVTGLTVSSPVVTNGFKVGQVSEIKYLYENPGNIQVEITLDGNLKLPVGTIAELGSDLLGTASITLKMAQGTDYIPHGATLESSRAAGLLDNVSGDLLPGITSMMSKIDSMLVSVNTLVNDPALLAAIQSLDDITKNINAVSSNLSKASKNLPGVIDNASVLVNNLNSVTANLDSITAEINQLPLNETMSNIKTITNDLQHVTAQLKSNDSSLGMLVNDPQLYNNLNNAVASLDSLLTDIKRQPKRYINVSVF